MDQNLLFVLNSILLGTGLAMDAFSVSLANGLNEPQMHAKKTAGIAGVFSLFQFLMPLIGWTCVHTIVQQFQSFEKWIPWIALILLLYIGGKMLWEGIRNRGEEAEEAKVGMAALLVQGLATSIDALSVGFTIAEYNFLMALVSAAIIGAVTYMICFLGLKLGKTFGTKLAGKASILGGIILIGIGIEIFISGL
ncbi:MAG: manganese efflux pump MntP family protein [Lachnospiraceae bacterium]|nr:manganese efflux pump MntP family protein [Lachnospiraceae bacterium]